MRIFENTISMKRHLLIIAVLLSSFLNSYSTHIVGGEFQLVEQRAGLYDIYLNLYFDDVNGNPAAEDQFMTAYIYRKSDNFLMNTLDLTNQGKTGILYDNPDCQISDIKTSKIVYAKEGGFQFNLDYNDPGGYYIVWDRCCRNETIVNIDLPEDAGMVFYLHFPPIFDSNDNLTNWSSPVFNPIPATYACVFEPFILDFGATDIDNDILVYSLVDPLSGYSSPVDPNPTLILPEPYPTVTWKAGIDINNVIPGAPSLAVNSSTGLLSMTPSDVGLHVFSVLCEEFRNGKKIGEVRRDFQIFVFDGCQNNSPPDLNINLSLELSPPLDTAYVMADTIINGSDTTYVKADTTYTGGPIYNEGDTIVMLSESAICLDLFVTDDNDLFNNEKISVVVVPVNFTTTADLVSEGADKFVGGVGDTLLGWQICPPDCNDILENGDPFIYDVIVKDDGCPQPKSDTVRVYLELIPEPNEPPVLSITNFDSLEIIENEIVIEVFEIDTVTIDFTGLDVDVNDLLSLYATGVDFRLKDFGMEFPRVENRGGEVNATFNWIIDCDYFKNTEKDEFKLFFVLDDNSCYKENPDTILVTIKINHEVNIENLFVANVFTPNGDGMNDEFFINTLPRDKCDDLYEGFEIYNRWGKCIYNSKEREIKFDGAQLNDGIYYYKIEYTESTYKGWFTILR